MNKEEKLKFIHSKLLNISTKSPIMLIGEAAKLFRENYSGKIYKPTNKDDLLATVNEASDNRHLVFDFLSFLPLSDTSFIECIDKFKTLLILAEDTQIETNLLSNIKTIIKFSDSASSKLIGAKTAQEDWKAEEDKSNLLKYMAKNSPEWYYYKNKFNMSKYIDLFSSDLC